MISSFYGSLLVLHLKHVMSYLTVDVALYNLLEGSIRIFWNSVSSLKIGSSHTIEPLFKLFLLNLLLDDINLSIVKVRGLNGSHALLCWLRSFRPLRESPRLDRLSLRIKPLHWGILLCPQIM